MSDEELRDRVILRMAEIEHRACEVARDAHAAGRTEGIGEELAGKARLIEHMAEDAGSDLHELELRLHNHTAKFLANVH